MSSAIAQTRIDRETTNNLNLERITSRGGYLLEPQSFWSLIGPGWPFPWPV